MQKLLEMVATVAPSEATVMITGESGTGKEVCAEAIHEESPRRDNPFIALNGAAMPRDLMESEIFGHIKGSFTGALAGRDGAATRADATVLEASAAADAGDRGDEDEADRHTQRGGPGEPDQQVIQQVVGNGR